METPETEKLKLKILDPEILETEKEEIPLETSEIPLEKKKNYYFDNAKVEELLHKYVHRGCTDQALRDEIMSNAGELIRQIIRTHHLYNIFPGRDESSFNELFQVAWCQIEKTLYKYDGRPGSPKVFNLWSQVAKTRILAYLKKEKRDKKNMPAYKDYVVRKYKTKSKSIDEFSSFLEEISNFFEYDENYKELCLILKRIWETDPKPYDGLKNKLIQISKKDPIIINQFLKLLKLHRDEFTINNKKDHEFEELESNEGYFYMDHDDF